MDDLIEDIFKFNDKIIPTLRRVHGIDFFIKVNHNDTVSLNIENQDALQHGLHLPPLGVDEAIPPLRKTIVSFIASKKGYIGGDCVINEHGEYLDVEVN